MEEKELDLNLDFSDLIYDYENRVPCGAASGRPLPQQQITQADEQCSPLHFPFWVCITGLYLYCKFQ